MSKDTKTEEQTTPSIEQYNGLKDELTKSILKKRELDAKLNELEDLIYDKENDYFSESTYGNIVKGFDNFGKNNSGGSNKKRIQYSDEDHIFSLSSANYVKTLMKRQGLSNSGSKEDLDEYEDSVDPGNQNAAANNLANNHSGNNSPSSNTNTSETANSNYSGRKRKVRTFDD